MHFLRYRPFLSLSFTAFAVVCLTHSGPASAAASQDTDHALLMQLAARLDSDDAKIAADHATIGGLQAKLARAYTAPAASTSYGPFTVTGKDVYLTGYNLHIQSGSGSTAGTVNGLGNLIIGYNEAGSSPKRTGSHNLILGTQNNYSSYGGIVDGNANTISGIYASIVGGRSGTATGSYSCIAGGYENTAKTIYTAALGPMSTAAIAPYGSDGTTHSGYLVTFTGANVQIVNGLGATNGEPSNPTDTSSNTLTNGLGNLIIGYNGTSGSGDDERSGSHNLILGDKENYYSFGGIVAGDDNSIVGPYACVSGGQGNAASGDYSSVSGGEDNSATGDFASVIGGELNTAGGIASSVIGGDGDKASANFSLAGGGLIATASGEYSTNLGSTNSTASGYSSSTIGGTGNRATNSYSSVTGGESNSATGLYSSVSGGENVTESNTAYWKAGSLESY